MIYSLSTPDIDRLSGIISSIDRPDEVILNEFELYVNFYKMGQESTERQEIRLQL